MNNAKPGTLLSALDGFSVEGDELCPPGFDGASIRGGRVSYVHLLPDWFFTPVVIGSPLPADVYTKRFLDMLDSPAARRREHALRHALAHRFGLDIPDGVATSTIQWVEFPMTAQPSWTLREANAHALRLRGTFPEATHDQLLQCAQNAIAACCLEETKC